MKFCLRIVLLLTLSATFSSCSATAKKERVFVSKPDVPRTFSKSEPYEKKKMIQTASIKVPETFKVDQRFLIVIDAGHGGKDEGAQSHAYPKCLEKTMTLSTAKILNSFLQGFGYRTVMTRSDDTFIGLSERAKFANDRKPKLFVSVHYNAAENRKADGIEVYYYQTETDAKRSAASKKLASTVLDHIISHTKSKSRGVKHGNFAVIRETKMPAILVEGGFMTNDKEMEKIRDANYMKKLAWGIAQGVRKYLTQE